MTIDVVLGIDIGTSGVRIAATDRGEHAEGHVRRPDRGAAAIDGGRILQDPAIWWNAVARRLQGPRPRRPPCPRHRHRRHLGHHPAPSCDDGTPAGLASMYNDVAEAAHLALVAAVAPRETAALGSTSPLARAMEMRRPGTPHHPSGRLDHGPALRPLRRDRREQRAEIRLRSGHPPLAGLDRQQPASMPRCFPASFPPAPRSRTITAGHGRRSLAFPPIRPSSPAPPMAAPPSSPAAHRSRATASPRSAPRSP